MCCPLYSFPSALSKCDANSKQVQISLLSKICHKRYLHSHFFSSFQTLINNARALTQQAQNKSILFIRGGGWYPHPIERKLWHIVEALVIRPPQGVIYSSHSCKMETLPQRNYTTEMINSSLTLCTQTKEIRHEPKRTLNLPQHPKQAHTDLPL